MDLQIRSNGTKVTDGMREFIDRRMSKLDRLADRVVDAQLELRTEQQRSGGKTTTAQITLHTGRHILRAEERDAEPAKAIDAAIDKLVHQVRRYGDKRTNKKRRTPLAQVVADPSISSNGYEPLPAAAVAESPPTARDNAAAVEVEEDDSELEQDHVVRTKRFPMKPMMVAEAIDQLELIGHEFFLFHNADEDQLNVVYRRRDGTYGLLAPTRP